MNPRIQYVLDYFRQIHQIPDDIEIGYGADHCKVNVLRSQTTYFNSLQKFDASRVTWKQWRDRRIPILFGNNRQDSILTQRNGNIIIQDDILLSAFFFLSGWQEYVYFYSHNERFYPYVESIQSQLSITQMPIVQIYFDILKTAIEKSFQRSFKIRNWNGKSFSVCLTHDVDKCQTGWLEDWFYTLKHGEFGKSLHIISQRIGGKDTWNNFTHILDLEKKFNAHSTFYFMTRRKQSGGENGDYHISHDTIQRILSEIKNRDHEIGIHGSIGSHISKNSLQQDLKRIGYPVTGNRFHYLSFHNPQTLAILEENELKYDSTLGFAEEIGFRNGSAWPFPLFDCQRNTVVPVLEIPLIIMDTSLRKYQNKHPEEIFPVIKDLLNRIRQVNGCCTILWHNNYFSGYKFKEWGKLYRKVLETVHHDAWLASGEEIYHHCRFLMP